MMEVKIQVVFGQSVFIQYLFCIYLAVSANEGDAYPLGALPVGTLVNNLEIQPGKGSEYIRAAGNLLLVFNALCSLLKMS